MSVKFFLIVYNNFIIKEKYCILYMELYAYNIFLENRLGLEILGFIGNKEVYFLEGWKLGFWKILRREEFIFNYKYCK